MLPRAVGFFGSKKKFLGQAYNPKRKEAGLSSRPLSVKLASDEVQAAHGEDGVGEEGAFDHFGVGLVVDEAGTAEM